MRVLYMPGSSSEPKEGEYHSQSSSISCCSLRKERLASHVGCLEKLNVVGAESSGQAKGQTPSLRLQQTEETRG